MNALRIVACMELIRFSVQVGDAENAPGMKELVELAQQRFDIGNVMQNHIDDN